MPLRVATRQHSPTRGAKPNAGTARAGNIVLDAGVPAPVRRAVTDWCYRPALSMRCRFAAGYRVLANESRAPSHRGAQHPWCELGAAEVEALALRRLAGGGLQDQIEDALAALLHRL